MSEHVHDCTTPDGRCACGWTFTVPRFAVSIDVFDNKTKRQLVCDGFNTDAVGVVVRTLEEVARKLAVEAL